MCFKFVINTLMSSVLHSEIIDFILQGISVYLYIYIYVYLHISYYRVNINKCYSYVSIDSNVLESIPFQ